MSKKVYIFLADGFEDIEGLTVVDLMRRAGITITTVSIKNTKQITTAHGITMLTDTTFREADFSDADMLVLPGGQPGTTYLGGFEPLTDLVKSFYNNGGKIAAICAAPTVFAEIGLLHGKKATAYPACMDGLGDAVKSEEKVVIDGNITTSRGLGTAIAYPQAKYLHKIGANVDVIMGFKNKDLIILKDELEESSDNLYITTDDGSFGKQGFVTQVLEENIDNGKDYDHVLAIGPAIMMKNVVKITKESNIPTTVSMNSIMVDGTGMCGCCRLTVGGEMKFACVDGPDFDGFLVDFDEAMNRSRNYATEEREHICNITGEVRHGKI